MFKTSKSAYHDHHGFLNHFFPTYYHVTITKYIIFLILMHVVKTDILYNFYLRLLLVNIESATTSKGSALIRVNRIKSILEYLALILTYNQKVFQLAKNFSFSLITSYINYIHYSRFLHTL